MKAIYLVTLITLVIIFLIPVVSTFAIRYVQFEPQPPNVYTEKIFGEKKVTGKFSSLENNLAGIGVSIKNPNLLNKNDMRLTVSSEDGQVNRSSEVSGWSIPDGDLVKFTFQQIPDSKAKTYFIEFSSPQSLEAYPFEIYLTTDRSISLIQYFKVTSKMSLILTIFGDFAKRFFADPVFVIFYLMLLFGLSLFFFKKNN